MDPTGDLITLYREGAIVMRLASTPPEVVVEFKTDDTIGQIAISVWPDLSLTERTLFAGGG
jgi:hypothetical protein